MQLLLLSSFTAVALLWNYANSLVALEFGRAELNVTFKEYRNPRNRLIDGTHCDSDFQGNAESECDPTFQFDFLREGGAGESLSKYTQADYFPNTGFVSFKEKIGKMDNPLVLDVNMSEATTHSRLFMKVRVEDNDRNWDNQLMDIFVYIFEDELFTPVNVDLVNRATGNRLLFQYHFKCKPDYYGNRCRNYCVSQNDTTGHYSCSSMGEKVCLTGWINIDEDCKVPDWCRWC